jgi:hypothetical protein
MQEGDAQMKKKSKYLPLIVATFVFGIATSPLGFEVLKGLGSCPLGFIGL